MQIEYQFRGLTPRNLPKRPIDQELHQLGRLISINQALVVLEHQPESAPPFCAAVDLAIPGSDIRAAARDHTLEAALLKVLRRLEDAVANRCHDQELGLKGRDSSVVVAPLAS